MTSFPVPANEVIQDGDRKRKGRHFAPRAAIGVEKRAPGPGWRHFRPRHLGSKMARAEMTSGGRRDVLQTSAPSMSPVEVWLYLDLKSIWSLASPKSYCTQRAADLTSCTWTSMVKWDSSISSPIYILPHQTYEKHLVIHVWACLLFL